MTANLQLSTEKVLPIAAFAIVGSAAAFGLASSLSLLHHLWTLWYTANEHGYIVLAASLWIAITTWRADPPRSLRPDWWALLPFVALVATLCGLELMLVNNSRLTLLPLLLLSAAALVFGREAARRIFWAAAFLYFALPQWAVINGPLQAVTTFVVTYAVHLTRVPAFVTGNFVQLPSGTFEIAAGCSGLNYLQAGMALAAFYALTYLQDWRHRIALLTVAAVAALVSNWIRVYVVILVGHLTNMQHYLITHEHHTFGWVLFLVSISPVFFLGIRLERREQSSVPAKPEGATSPVAVSPRVLVAAVAAAAVLLLPRAVIPESASVSTAATQLPSTLNGESRTIMVGGWTPTFMNANEDSASFGGSSPAVDVYRAVYPHQDSDHRLIRPGNDFLGPTFQLLEQQRRDVQLENGRTFGVTEYRGVLRDRPRVVWAWYWVAGRAATGAFEAKFAEARGLLNSRRDAVAIAIATDCEPDCNAAQQRLATFVYRHEARLRWSPENP